MFLGATAPLHYRQVLLLRTFLHHHATLAGLTSDSTTAIFYHTPTARRVKVNDDDTLVQLEAEVLQEPQAWRFRFTDRAGSQLGGYKGVSDLAMESFSKALQHGGELDYFTIQVLRRLGERDYKAIHRVLSAISRTPQKVHWSVFSSVLHGSIDESSEVSQQLFAKLEHARATGPCKDLLLPDGSVPDVRLDALLAEYEEVFRSIPSKAVSSLEQAKVLSLRDRRLAYEKLAAARELMPGYFIDTVMDRGANTYFDADALPPFDRALLEDPRLEEKLSQASVFAAGARLPLVISLDTRFLRIYGPYWMSIAARLYELGFPLILLVIGDDAEVAVADSIRLLEELHRFRNRELHREKLPVCFLPFGVPSYVVDRDTFYASLRFLAAPLLLSSSQLPLLMIDADMTISKPLDALSAQLSSADFGCVLSTGALALHPWRRYMGGTVYCAPTSGGIRIAEDMARYIHHGLKHSGSWSLDQNALTFAVEESSRRGSEQLHLFDAGQRPFIQVEFRSLIEHG